MLEYSPLLVYEAWYLLLLGTNFDIKFGYSLIWTFVRCNLYRGANMASRALTRATSKDRAAPAPHAQPTRADANKPHPGSGDAAEPTELTLTDIQRSINHSSATVCAKLDALTEEVASIKVKLSALEDSVQMNSDKLIDIENVKLPRN